MTEIYPKRVQLPKELVPKAARIGVLFNMANSALPPQWKEVEKAARVLSMEPQLLDVRKAGDLEPAFDAAVRQRADGLIVGIDTLTQANRRVIVDLAARRRLPAMYASTECAGGLISYGVNYPAMYRRAAGFAHKIFRGARPADLPWKNRPRSTCHRRQDGELPRSHHPARAAAQSRHAHRAAERGPRIAREGDQIA